MGKLQRSEHALDTAENSTWLVHTYISWARVELCNKVVRKTGGHRPCRPFKHLENLDTDNASFTVNILYMLSSSRVDFPIQCGPEILGPNSIPRTHLDNLIRRNSLQAYLLPSHVPMFSELLVEDIQRQHLSTTYFIAFVGGQAHADFSMKRKTVTDFWLEMPNKFVYFILSWIIICQSVVNLDATRGSNQGQNC